MAKAKFVYSGIVHKIRRLEEQGLQGFLAGAAGYKVENACQSTPGWTKFASTLATWKRSVLLTMSAVILIETFDKAFSQGTTMLRRWMA